MEVGSLSVPVRADLGPITADLAKLRQQLAAISGAQSPFGELEREVNRARGSVNGLTAALGPLARTLAGVLGVRQLIQFADTWSDISSRVNLAAGSIERGGAVLDRLQIIARRTYSSLTLTSESYIRNAQTLRDLGRSTQQTLDYTEALNLALVVSGARGDRAARVQEALGRAQAQGSLRGTELNTVIESGGRVAELLAEELGTTVSGLRRLGQQGKITGDVIDRSLTGNLKLLQEQAEAMPATIGDAFVLIGNALLRAVGVFDQANQISGSFAETLIIVADNMERLLSYVVAGTAAWGAYRAGVIAVNAGLFTTAGALTAVRTALQRLLFATVIGGIIVVIGELLFQLYQARQASDSWGEAFAKLGLRLRILFDGIQFAFFAVIEAMQASWADFLSFMLTSANENFGGILRLFGFTTESINASLARLAQSSMDYWGASASSAVIAAAQIKAAFADFDLPEGVDLSGDGGRNRTTPAVDAEAERKAKRLREAYEALIRDSKSFIEQQQLEARTIGMTDLEAAKLRATFDLLNQAKRAGITLTAAQTAELTKLAEQSAEAEYATNKLREAYEFNKDVFKGFFNDLRQSLQNGATIWEAFGNAAANALQKIADKALDLALNGIFDLIFGAFNIGKGGGGGGIGGFIANLFKAENGTSFAPGGVTLVGERGPELVTLPGGAQVTPNNRVTAPMQASFGGGFGSAREKIEIDVFVKDDGKIGAIARQEAASVVEVSISDYDTNQLPNSVQRISNHPRQR